MTATLERVLPATCWCERTVVMIPVQWVSEARTGSCGPNCGPGCPSRASTQDEDPNEEGTALPTRKKHKMNRFDPAKYDPRDDSTVGYRSGGVRVEHPNGLILQVVGGEPPLCGCGCAEAPRGRGATFGMGHDARLRGKLARALAGGAEVVLTDANHIVHEVLGPQDYAARFSTDKLDWAASVADSAARAGSAGRAAEERVMKRALGPQIGDTKLIKVGRWEKTGRVMAVYRTGDGTDRVVYEYADAKGGFHRVEENPEGKLREVEVA